MARGRTNRRGSAAGKRRTQKKRMTKRVLTGGTKNTVPKQKKGWSFFKPKPHSSPSSEKNLGVFDPMPILGKMTPTEREKQFNVSPTLKSQFETYTKQQNLISMQKGTKPLPPLPPQTSNTASSTKPRGRETIYTVPGTTAANVKRAEANKAVYEQGAARAANERYSTNTAAYESVGTLPSVAPRRRPMPAPRSPVSLGIAA